MLAKKTVKNQITLPKKVVEQFPSARYFDVRVQEGEIVLRPVDVDRPSAAEVRSRLEGLGITQDDVREAIRWARSRPR